MLVAHNNFQCADKDIERLGYASVNPMNKSWPKYGAPWLLHMAVDLWKLLWCDAVYFQRNWSDSRGASIEFQVALFLGKELIYQK